MTSEICVMNRRALVLAADSAATVTYWSGKQREVRYFKGANKIFQLVADRPIGIMVFDSGDLHDIPWEIVIKDFRNNFSANRPSDVSTYASAFFKYINDHALLFSSSRRREITQRIFKNSISLNLGIIIEDENVIAGQDKALEISKAFQKICSQIKGLPIEEPFKEEDIEAALSFITPDISAFAEDLLVSTSTKNIIDKDELIGMSILSIFKHPKGQLINTGIVVAGYGDDDYFPCYHEYSCSGFLGDKLYWKPEGDVSMDRIDTGIVRAFATTAMVDTFQHGVGPDVFNAVTSSLEDTLWHFAEEILKSSGAQPPSNLQNLVENAASRHTREWIDKVFQQHVQPLNRVVGFLPVSEMASLAESLVELESLKEKVTQPSESVGGPIDVAAITKSEGFVWIKRKHYFSIELNPRYAARYNNHQ
ncbi:hypothetical protein [Prosthecomicrobium hirschii]|uniref:hypothetical protein n=1 Tax=Prosthecodimorpha hirschii TaxID=665126 RepID=UPI000B2D8A86|nr:hypothetical protein [Prosthecomicrobium hirschii]